MKSNSIYIFCIFLSILLGSQNLLAQSVLTQQEEEDITLSDEFYSEYGYGDTYEAARISALETLQETVLEDAVRFSMTSQEILSAVEMRARYSAVESVGNVIVLSWIDKDSIMITVEKPLRPAASHEGLEEPVESASVAASVNQTVTADIHVPDRLLECGNIMDFHRALTYSGCIFSNINSSDGFSDPSKCHVAVFGKDGSTRYILSPGGVSRTDVLTGEVVSSEVILNSSDYNVLYFLILN